MKKIIYTLGLIALSYYTKAADLIVQENGGTGTYSSITGAIIASSDGDRIIIHPKLGGDSWIENLTINKSLELVSSQDTTRYKIQGDISIIASAGRKVTITSAEVIGGDISGSSSGFVTTVNVLGSILISGKIQFGDQFDVHVISNILNNGDIVIAKGNVIGNEVLNFNRIEILGANVTDTINIIANKVGSIYCNTFVFLNIKNNHIKTMNGSSYENGIHYNVSGSNVSNKLLIENNVIESPEGYYLDSRANTYLRLSGRAIIKNNVFVEITNSNSNGPYLLIASSSDVSYNFVYGGAVGNSGVTQLTSYPINVNGRLILPSPTQNGADPSFKYYDLDLTRGDAGCYGGSYTLDNYFPITGSSKVFDIDMPFGLTTGGTLDIKAKGFDR